MAGVKSALQDVLDTADDLGFSWKCRERHDVTRSVPENTRSGRRQKQSRRGDHISVKSVADALVSDRDTFYKFIELYGTHFVKGAMLGGLRILNLEMSACALKTNSVQKIQGAVEGQLRKGLYEVEGSAETEFQNDENLARFASSAKSSSETWGGDATATYENWPDTVDKENMGVIGYEVSPLFYAMDATAPRTNAFKQAIAAYFEGRSVPESKRLPDIDTFDCNEFFPPSTSTSTTPSDVDASTPLQKSLALALVFVYLLVFV